MRDLPSNHLNPKIKAVWRFNDCLALILAYLICMAPFAIVYLIEPELSWSLVVVIALSAAFALLLILFLFVIPPIRYARWRYELNPNYLDIARGIIWKKRFIIPFIRVQNTDTSQGPILRAFGLANVTVSTAAGAHEIPGIGAAEADELRDRAAEFARLAREDV